MSDLNLEVSQIIDSQKETFAKIITDEYYRQHPELNTIYGKDVRNFVMQDNRYHLTYLAEAVAAGHPSFFANYIGWAKVLLNGMNIPSEELARNLKLVRSVLQQQLQLHHQDSSLIDEYIEQGLHQLPLLPTEIASFIEEDQPQAELAQQYLDHLLQGKRHLASRLILDAVENKGVNVKEIYLNVFQHAQYEIGRLWQMNQISVAQEHYCTAATQLIMSQLYTYIFSTEKQNKTMVATCVGGDLHELGVRMVADFFEMEGWDTYYLGANTPTISILQELRERSADLLAISVTMTFHVRAAEALIAAVRADPECKNVKIMVGGYPFNLEPELWRQVGADGYSGDAQQAIDISNQLVH
ncbi:MAG: cobalamin-dependent protein [Thiotrichaceae bacterium]